MLSNLPLSTVQGGLVVTSSILINATKQKVWDILMDFPKYREWNPALRAVAVLDAEKQPNPDQKPVVGQSIQVSMQTPATMDPNARPNTVVELIIDVDYPNYRFAWRSPSVGMMFRAERYFALIEVEDKTLFEMRETFGGGVSYGLKLFRAKIEQTSHAMAEALKERSEQ